MLRVLRLNREQTKANSMGIGRVIKNRYRTEAKIGQGGMGDVYRGCDLDLGRGVAIKLIPAAHETDARMRQRFLDQARTLAQVEHRNVVRVYERGTTEDGVAYVVTELLEGRDLAAWLESKGALPITTSVRIATQICWALQAAHDAGVLHRDVKPSNVFVLERKAAGEGDEGPTIKLIDFGLARLAQDSDSTTRTGELVGTLPYLAPEVLTRKMPHSSASDVYAVGCLLYEMLSGRAPFRARSESELVLAICADTPPELPIEHPLLSTIVTDCLSKDPQERPESAASLADLLEGLILADSDAAPPPSTQQPVSLAGGRFQPTARLGAGQSGTVFGAIDTRSGEEVAVKRLHHRGPEQLYRLKREFRTLRDLQHTNLVRLEELVFTARDACVAMEWVHGKPFLTYCLAHPDHVDHCLVQLLDALVTMHMKGLVHRDIKPSNVLVEANGRVVVLDFGLTVVDRGQTFLAGTPDYLAPECLQGVISEKGDIYATGVMLYQVLHGGALPSEPRHTFPPEAPAHLARLCSAMLASQADARPSASEALARLTASQHNSPHQPRASARPAEAAAQGFIGRAAPLSHFEQALLAGVGERAQALLVEGPSGIGKSSLLAEMAARIPAEGLCLTSRCRTGESVPFRGLDAALDTLTEALRHMPRPLVAALAPQHSGALVRVFPAFARIEVLTGASRKGTLPADPVQIRMLAYQQLRELFTRVAAAYPLVLFVDDLQWIDSESATLLSYVLSGPNPPPLLFVGAARTGSDTPTVPTRLLASLGYLTRLRVDTLSPEETLELTRALLKGEGEERDRLCEMVAKKSGGHPLFVRLLADHARSTKRVPDVSMEGALRSRIRSLSAASYDALCLVALSRKPLETQLARRLVDQASAHTWGELEQAHLLRQVPIAQGDALEPYHDKVRETVVGDLTPEATRALHARLAEALRGDANGHSSAAIEHLAAAGRETEAAALAEQAAAEADRALDFERAAALYGVAARSTPPGTEAWHRLERHRAQALRRNGHFVQAAEVFMTLANAGGTTARRDRTEAGALFMAAGDLLHGFALLKPVLTQLGLPTPEGIEDALTLGLGGFQRLLERGLSPRNEETRDDDTEERFHVCARTAGALAIVDPRGVVFAIEALLMALDTGNASQLQQATAIFLRVTAGLFHNPLLEPALALCRETTTQVDTPSARIALHLATGEVNHFGGRFLEASAAFATAERLAVESGLDAHHELASARNGFALIEYSQKGDFTSQLKRTLAWQADAAARKDYFHESVLRVAHAIVWIAQDDTGKAIRELNSVGDHWPRDASAFEVGRLLYLDVVDRYLGREDAHLHPIQGVQAVLQSPAAQSPFLSGYIHMHRAWGALRIIATGRHTAEHEEMLATAIETLRNLGPVGWLATADAIEANLDFLEGDREVALLKLEQAEQRYLSVHMRCLAACALRRRGELAGSDFGARLVEDGDQELARLGVLNPARWSRAYFSLFDPEQVLEVTRHAIS